MIREFLWWITRTAWHDDYHSIPHLPLQQLMQGMIIGIILASLAIYWGLV